MPIRNMRRRPDMSATRPKSSVNPAEQSANAVAIHCRFSSAKPTSAPMVGSATLRIEKSTASVKLAVSRTTSATRCLPVSTAPGAGSAMVAVSRLLRGLWARVVTGTSRRVRAHQGSMRTGFRDQTSPPPRTATPSCLSLPGLGRTRRRAQTVGMSGPNELGEFLRVRRAALQPEDVGLQGYGVRRVPGLRREELAMLAGVSPTYYSRLEQGLSTNASEAVIASIARALNLTRDEQAHLFNVARPERSPRRRAAARPDRVRTGTLRLINSPARCAGGHHRPAQRGARLEPARAPARSPVTSASTARDTSRTGRT